MERKILTGEAVFQTVISLLFFSYAIADYFEQKPGTEFFIALFYIGISNLICFLLRVSLSKSSFNGYFFYGVILFFIIRYFVAFCFIVSRLVFLLGLMGIGGVLFIIYYLIYGFYIVKTLQQIKTEN